MSAPRQGTLSKVAGTAIRHPWRVVAAWGAILIVLGVAGLDAKSVLRTSADLTFQGSESTSALQLDRSKFGRRETLAVLLEGPRGALRRYGPSAARSLDRIRGVTAISPWSRGAPPGLKISSNKAMLLLEVNGTPTHVGQATTPAVRSTLGAELPDAVESHVTGVPAMAEAVVRDTFAAMDRAQSVAIPALLVILLLIFRSPLAAAIPLVLGVSVITAGSGVLTLIGRSYSLDSTALQLMSLTGLALGVDYSLLIVSRFREELGKGGATSAIVSSTMAAAGRTAVVAGSVVAVGMVVLAYLFGEAVLSATCLGVLVASMLSVALATTLLPAILTLVGPGINRWRIGRRSARPMLAPFVRRLIRRPGIATALALVPLLLLGVPALGVEIGPPHGEQLGKDNREAREFHAVESSAGGGWAAPFEVLATSSSGPVTTPSRLAALARFQAKLSKDPNVAAVLGPGPLSRENRKLVHAATALDDGAGKLDRLSAGLAKANRGFAKLQAGLGQAQSGSGALASATEQAFAGANALSAGTVQATAGIAALNAGLPRIQAGAGELGGALGQIEQGTRGLGGAASQAEQGAGSLADAAYTFKQNLGEGQADLTQLEEVPRTTELALAEAQDQLSQAADASKSDPGLAAAQDAIAGALVTLNGTTSAAAYPAQPAAGGFSAALEDARSQSSAAAEQALLLSYSASSLAAGVGRLQAGNRRLSLGARSTLAGAGRLTGAARRARGAGQALGGRAPQLAQGTRSLVAGLGTSNDAANALDRRLAENRTDGSGLGYGLSRVSGQVERANGQLESATRGQRIDPSAAAGSGYLTLGAIDAASPDERRNANLVVNADRAGDTARLFVISKTDPLRSPGASRLASRLRNEAPKLGRELGAPVRVGGRAAIIQDYASIASGKRLPVIVALAAVTFLFLTLVFRSLLLAAKAVVLNLLVVGAAFGAVSLLFVGEEPVLGGAGWIDAIAFFATYALVFTLSMDYEIFMINRMREGYAVTGSNDAAIEYGIDRTARVITGAAAVMVIVFASFAVFGSGLIRQVGVALSVAVVVDATLVRLILLPATMRLFGKWNWWLPEWLERRLPRVNLEGGRGA